MLKFSITIDYRDSFGDLYLVEIYDLSDKLIGTKTFSKDEHEFTRKLLIKDIKKWIKSKKYKYTIDLDNLM